MTSNQIDVGGEAFRKGDTYAKGSEQGRESLIEKLRQVQGVLGHRVSEQRWLASHQSHPAKGHQLKAYGLGEVTFPGSICFLACPLPPI